MLSAVLSTWKEIGHGAEKQVFHHPESAFVVKVCYRRDQLLEREARYPETCNWVANSLTEWENWQVIRRYPWLRRFFARIIGAPRWCPIHRRWYYLQEYIPCQQPTTRDDSEIADAVCRPLELCDADYQFYVVPGRGVVIYDFGFDTICPEMLEDGWTLNSDGSENLTECGSQSDSTTSAVTTLVGPTRST